MWPHQHDPDSRLADLDLPGCARALEVALERCLRATSRLRAPRRITMTGSYHVFPGPSKAVGNNEDPQIRRRGMSHSGASSTRSYGGEPKRHLVRERLQALVPADIRPGILAGTRGCVMICLRRVS